jgi:hypothetical protein
MFYKKCYIFFLYFVKSFTAVILIATLTTAVFGGSSDITPIGEDGVYIKGSHCVVNMEEKHTDEYYLRYVFSECLSAHAEFLYGNGETK